MGFLFTLLYILTAFLSPTLLFGDLAEYHVQVIIAMLAVLASIPSIPGSGIFRLPQFVAIAGMTFSVIASFVFAGLIGLSPTALYDFLPDCFAFFLIVLNCQTKRRMQAVILTLVLASFWVIINGGIALNAGIAINPYVFDQGYEGVHVLRLRGLGFVHDPNDLAQVLVSLMPCMFFFWKPKKSAWNFLFVLLPSCVLFAGVFLTHSRGALVAVMAVIAIVVYRRFGLVAATLMAVATFALSSALSWSGGRDISVEAGNDRMEAWATGLELIRSHPIFGVGYKRFTEYNIITAHNTVVVCAAELGFVGFFFWVLFVVSSIRQSYVLRTPAAIKSSEDNSTFSYAPATLHYQPAPAAEPLPSSFPPSSSFIESAAAPVEKTSAAPFGFVAGGPRVESEASIRQMAWIMVICFAGFLTAGWFLSRAYVMWIFIYGGMTQVIYRMAVECGIAPPPASLPRLLKISFMLSVALVLLVYIILRAKKLLP